MLKELKNTMQRAFDAYKDLEEGSNIHYIPILKNIDSNLTALVFMDTYGNKIELGDYNYEFAIESISKIMTLGLVLNEYGTEIIKEKVGNSATGLPFNSVLALELHDGKPMSALVNAGAMSTVSIIEGNNPAEKWNKIFDFQCKLAGRKLNFSDEINNSEQATNDHNKAIAFRLKSSGYIYSDPLEACDIYTRQCSVLFNTTDLATVGATLANGGYNPITREVILNEKVSSKILSEMFMEGLYDSSGKWAYEVGVPSKSGVGGGIVSVIPNVGAIAAFSPKLDEVGNSVRGQLMIKKICNEMEFNIFKTEQRR